MRFAVPHPIPYQGSKRRLAEAILSHIPAGRFERLIEPFAGSAAVTLACASRNLFPTYLLGDALEPLTDLWQAVILNPSVIASEYEQLWLRERAKPIDAYYEIRAEFNASRGPGKLLYLLARCVKNAVRFNPSGEFNQSPDKRRRGTHPDLMRAELLGAHRILADRSEVRAADFVALLKVAKDSDLVYLDPPYQGTSDGRDSRYIAGVSREAVLDLLTDLNRRGIEFILSYDGSSGGRCYGEPLSEDVAHQIRLDVGRSSQATLNGTSDRTVESLYLSYGLADMAAPRDVCLNDFARQSVLFA
jgi:DNA adenine methylase